MTTFDVAGFNGKRHWPRDTQRAVTITERLARGSGGADIIGGNELNSAMVRGMREAGFIAKTASSNSERGAWNGNAIAWNPDEWEASRVGQMRVVFRYWPGKKFYGRRFVFWKKAVVYFPWAELVNRKDGTKVSAMVVHFPTDFNAKPKARARMEAKVERWLTAKVPEIRIVIGDTNRMRLRNPNINFVAVISAVGIWVNNKAKVGKVSRVNLTGLSDHPVAPRVRLSD